MSSAQSYRLLSRVVRPLPWWLVRLLGFVGGHIMWATQSTARQTSQRHAARVRHGDPQHVSRLDRRIARKRFASYGRYFLETFWLNADRHADILDRFELEGEKYLTDALAAGDGVVLAAAHIGNWDYAAIYPLSLGAPIIAVAEDLADDDLTEWFVAMRAEAGIEIVLADGTKGSFLQLVRAVKSGRVVALLCDRDVSGTGVPVTFFGEETRLPAGPVVLAAAAGAPVLPVVCYLTKSGYRFVVDSPMKFTKADLGDTQSAAMQQVVDRLEPLIRRAPEQWHVLQPNWPSDPGYTQ
jgi:lauroyl/myristoyl acyltransferase